MDTSKNLKGFYYTSKSNRIKEACKQLNIKYAYVLENRNRNCRNYAFKKSTINKLTSTDKVAVVRFNSSSNKYEVVGHVMTVAEIILKNKYRNKYMQNREFAIYSSYINNINDYYVGMV